jgi:transcriptional regulator with XRE-family HTH domain
MTLGRRIEERRVAVGISQAELARRVGIRQSTMNSLINGDSRSSRSIVQIARELGTTPSYLLGETHDPDLNAVPAPPPAPPVIMLSVNLPPERALARMFQALLAGIDPNATRDEQALLLAQRLPIGLSQLRDLLPDSVTVPPRRERADVDEALATPHPEPIR